MTATTATTLEQEVAVLAKALGRPARVRIMRLPLGVVLEEALEVDTSGCD